MNSLLKIWVRATGQLMGTTDTDPPVVPTLTRAELRVALALTTAYIILHLITCVFVIANVVRHW